MSRCRIRRIGNSSRHRLPLPERRRRSGNHPAIRFPLQSGCIPETHPFLFVLPLAARSSTRSCLLPAGQNHQALVGSRRTRALTHAGPRRKSRVEVADLLGQRRSLHEWDKPTVDARAKALADTYYVTTAIGAPSDWTCPCMTGHEVTLRLVNLLAGETRVASSISGRCADATL